MTSHYRALMCFQDSQGVFQQEVQEFPMDFLPKQEVSIRVHYSSLNYKDALSAFGKNKITKNYPHVTGIDAAGEVLSDLSGTFDEGDEVIVHGFDLGMNTFGAHATHIEVPVTWVSKKPSNFSLRETMCLGTAGFSAGLAWYKMQPYLHTLRNGEVLITGASGGVGAVATALLSTEDIRVVACSSKKEYVSRLSHLGASSIIEPSTILVDPKKPLSKPRWVGAIDNLGGSYLSSILASCEKEAAIIAVGLTSSAELSTSVLPFILNGVHLIGVNAADTSVDIREKVWKILSKRKEELMEKIEPIIEEVSLYELPQKMRSMLDRQIMGRIVVKIE